MSDLDTNNQPNPVVRLKLSAVDLDQKQHDPGDIDLLYRVYANKRIDSQVNFYQSRIKENSKNADFTFGAGAFVMTVSSLVATISATVRDPFWTPTLTVLSAILPAFAALLAAFRQLYGWERQINIYRDALLGLEKVRLLAPDNDRVAASSISDIYPELVTKSETVFNGEVSQWGQFVVEKEGAQSKGDAVMQQLFGDLNLTDEQRATIQSILVAGKTTDVNIQTNVVKSSDVLLQTELPAGTTVDGQEGGVMTTAIHTETTTSVNSQPGDQAETLGLESESETTTENGATTSVDLPPDVEPEDQSDEPVG